jgi:hypothetical protein
MRGIALGRNNRIFFGGDNRGRIAAVRRTFVASCERAKVDHWTFRDVLARIASHPVNQPDALLPRRWGIACVRYSAYGMRDRRVADGGSLVIVWPYAEIVV